MTKLIPKNINSSSAIPNNKIIKKVDDNNFAEVTAADITALGIWWGWGWSWTVTSVDMNTPSWLSISWNPITTAWTLSLSYATGYQWYTTVEATKLANIAVTQSVNLDQMETDIAALANGMVYKWNRDASSWTFPWGWTAQMGAFYTVSVAWTVDSVTFNVWDRLIATADNASTTVYTGNWTQLDATDAVTSVFGRTGNVVATAWDYTATQVTNTPAWNIAATTVQWAINELDTEKANLSGWTFTGDISVPDEVYWAGRDGSMEVPTKNALYDKIETLSSPDLSPVYRVWWANADFATISYAIDTVSGLGKYWHFYVQWDHTINAAIKTNTPADWTDNSWLVILDWCGDGKITFTNAWYIEAEDLTKTNRIVIKNMYLVFHLTSNTGHNRVNVWNYFWSSLRFENCVIEVYFWNLLTTNDYVSSWNNIIYDNCKIIQMGWANDFRLSESTTNDIWTTINNSYIDLSTRLYGGSVWYSINNSIITSLNLFATTRFNRCDVTITYSSWGYMFASAVDSMIHLDYSSWTWWPSLSMWNMVNTTILWTDSNLDISDSKISNSIIEVYSITISNHNYISNSYIKTYNTAATSTQITGSNNFITGSYVTDSTPSYSPAILISGNANIFNWNITRASSNKSVTWNSNIITSNNTWIANRTIWGSGNVSANNI